jgi:hypothetical protein
VGKGCEIVLAYHSFGETWVSEMFLFFAMLYSLGNDSFSNMLFHVSSQNRILYPFPMVQVAPRTEFIVNTLILFERRILHKC